MKIKRLIALITVFLLINTSLYAVSAEHTSITVESETTVAQIDGASFSNASTEPSVEEYMESTALLWDENLDWVEWKLSVPTAGEYNIAVEYCPLANTGMEIHRAIELNGESQNEQHGNAMLERFWQFESEKKTNAAGDEVCPRQNEILTYHTVRFMDGEGLYTRPLTFQFKAGENVLRMTYVSENIAIRKIYILSVETSVSYSELEKTYTKNGWKNVDTSVCFEAEDNLGEKNSATIFLSSDSDPAMTPANDATRFMNMVGGFQTADMASWQFTVPETGLYCLYLRDNFSSLDGLNGYCTIRLDGEVPCDELWEYKFAYSNRWRTEGISDDEGNLMRFYLTSGETHTLTVRTVCGPLLEQYEITNADYMNLTKMVRDIIKVTGSDPDVNYDYQITTAIPDLVSRIETLADHLATAKSKVDELSKKNSTLGNQLHSIEIQLREMVEDPDDIPRRLSDLQTLTGTYASVVGMLKAGTFTLDRFWWSSEETGPEDYKSSFFKRFSNSVKNFIRSFYKDYNSVSSTSSEEYETIRVWVSRGKEWAELIQDLTDTYFTPNEKINVNLNILPTGQLSSGGVNAIMLAIAAGTAPDAALGVAGASPFEYAIRGAAQDLTKMDGFDEVQSRFLDDMLIPFTYKDGIYAIPETATYRVMYYRTDIFEEFGINYPNTWDEVYNSLLPLLYKNGLEMCIPAMFDIFLLQNGGNYYSENGLRSGLDTTEAYQAFSQYIGLYIDYGVPVSMNFFNRFRTGESPIGIDTLSSYMTFRQAAPEIAGRWTIAPIPGTVQEDGTIDRSFAGMVQESCFILGSTDKADAAWKYLSWWTSSDTQISFQREVESKMGTSARWLSANTDAVNAQAWTKNEREVISVCREWGTEVPQVVGGYFTGRHILNAYTRCVVDGDRPRDSLEKCVKDINAELERRQKDFNIR